LGGLPIDAIDLARTLGEKPERVRGREDRRTMEKEGNQEEGERTETYTHKHAHAHTQIEREREGERRGSDPDGG